MTKSRKWCDELPEFPQGACVRIVAIPDMPVLTDKYVGHIGYVRGSFKSDYGDIVQVEFGPITSMEAGVFPPSMVQHGRFEWIPRAPE